MPDAFFVLSASCHAQHTLFEYHLYKDMPLRRSECDESNISEQVFSDHHLPQEISSIIRLYFKAMLVVFSLLCLRQCAHTYHKQMMSILRLASPVSHHTDRCMRC